jgi:hypothetical protein
MAVSNASTSVFKHSATLFLVVSLSSNAFISCTSGEAPPTPKKASVGKESSALIQGTTWFPIGPAPLQKIQTYGVTQRDPTAAGRATVIGVNPSNVAEVFLGTANAGLWHSTNVGKNQITWEPLTDGLGSLAVGSILLEACANPGIHNCGSGLSGKCGCDQVWLGTGENGIRRDTYYGAGVFLGKDRGTPEFHTFSFEPVADSATVFRYSAVNHIVRLGTSIIVSVSSDVTSNSTHATVSAPAPPGGYGLYKSDNEGPWTHIAVPGGDPADAVDLELIPGSTPTLIAGFMGQGLFRSTDGGTTWCSMNPGLPNPCSGVAACTSPTSPGCLPAATPLRSDGRTQFAQAEIAISDMNPSVQYSFFGPCGQPGPASALVTFQRRIDFGCSVQSGALFRSVNGGTSWDPVMFGTVDFSDTDNMTFGNVVLTAYPNYTHVLKADPTDPFSFFLGGLVLHRCNGTSAQNAMYPCKTLGTEWIHPDHHDLVFPIPGNNQLVYAANDGGFAISDNGGTDWNSVAMTAGGVTTKVTSDFAEHDLATTQFHSVATTPVTDLIIGGLQDNGWAQFNGTRAWGRLFLGDGGGTALDFIGAADTGYAVGYFTGSGPSFKRAWNRAKPSDTTDLRQLLGNTFSSFFSEPVAFYAPLRRNPTTHDIYYATNRLYQSTDKDTPEPGDPTEVHGDTWAVISPANMAENMKPYADIEKNNVITAIGLSSDKQRVYIGFYDGEIFGSVPPGPCDSLTCWRQLAGPAVTPSLPATPVTSIAVDPTTPTTIYASYSGFNIPAHVWKNVGADPNAWITFSNGLPQNPDVPVNVVAIENSNPGNLWLGADDGVWRTNGTATWSQELFNTTGLPRVPVYDISLDETHNRAIAATHGRGMWALTAPTVTTKEGWVKMNGDTSIWDIPIYGHGFLNTSTGNVPCVVELVQASGHVCAQGKKDATGGDIFIPPMQPTVQLQGVLQTTIPTSGGGDSRPAVWGCLDHHCLPDANGNPVSIDHCIHDANNNPDPVTEVKIVCDNGQLGFAHVNGAPFVVAPTSNIFHVDPPHASGSFDVLASVEDAFGATRVLCSTTIPFSASDSDAVIEQRIADSINASPACQAATVSADTKAEPVVEAEDNFAGTGVTLFAPGVSGAQLLLTLRLHANHAASGMCFTMDELGDQATHNLAIMRTAITTGPNGASGGALTITEQSNLGTCHRSIATTAGETAGAIAEAIRAAFQDPTNSLECPASENPVDVTREGADLITVLADTWTICDNDPGVGVTVGPEELDVGHLCTTPPSLVAPPPITITSCTNPAIGTATATSNCGGNAVVTNNAPSTFALGDTVVTWRAEDSFGNVTTSTQTVTAVLGDDTSCCPAGSHIMQGTSGVNILIGTSGSDCILGLGGDDQIFGNGGNDFISGGAGNDLISGGSGDDYVNGGDGIDHIHGDSGNDTLLGGAGNDDIDADSGNDTLVGGAGDDELEGDDGNDVMSGGDGADKLYGNDGTDTLRGDDGNDYLDGGPQSDIEDGGAGQDKCLRSLSSADTLISCETVIQ